MLRENSEQLEAAGDESMLQAELIKKIDSLNRLRAALNNKLGRV